MNEISDWLDEIPKDENRIIVILEIKLKDKVKRFCDYKDEITFQGEKYSPRNIIFSLPKREDVGKIYISSDRGVLEDIKNGDATVSVIKYGQIEMGPFKLNDAVLSDGRVEAEIN